MQRIANPSSPVRLRVAPPKKTLDIKHPPWRVFCFVVVAEVIVVRTTAALTARYMVGRVTTMRSAEVIKSLQADGWALQRVKGSHHHFRHPSKPGLVTIPHPQADIPLGTLRSIWKQAGWPWR